MDTKTILLFFIPIITAIASSYLTYYFTVQSKKNEAMFKYKEEKYSNMAVLLQGFVGATISGELKKRFFEEQYKSWLYCSDGVIKAINAMVEYVMLHRDKDPNPNEGKKVVGNIILEMRRDLLGKSKLTANDFRYTSVFDK